MTDDGLTKTLVVDNKQQVYELLFIIDSSIDEARAGATMEKISNDISEFGGSVIKYFFWGRKQLAYSIKHKNEGQYFLMYANFGPEFNFKKFERTLVLDDKILRFMILKTKKILNEVVFKSIDKNPKKRGGLNNV